MKKKKATVRKKKAVTESNANPEWQTGDYERHAEFAFILPNQFLMICKLMEVTPLQLITDFIDNLSCSSWNREGRELIKKKLIEYFIEHGYGQKAYSTEEIRKMFMELDSIGSIWPEKGDKNLVELTASWKKEYQVYWLNKWMVQTKQTRIDLNVASA